MTSEDIKKQRSMLSVIEGYGFHPNRAGFISCPFHSGDRQASMKIYKDSFYCFGCGASGDIFDFVQKMDDCSFKEAFFLLGGTYDGPSYASRLAIYRAQKARETREREERRRRQLVEHNNMLIDIYRASVARSEPLSDEWCGSYNALQYQLYMYEVIHGQGGGAGDETFGGTNC